MQASVNSSVHNVPMRREKTRTAWSRKQFCGGSGGKVPDAVVVGSVADRIFDKL